MSRRLLITTVLAFAAAAGMPTLAIAQASAPAAEVPENLYAVEITVGSAWDQAKKPNEQAYFKEHSTNLQKLREQGRIVMGARYGDKGLVIVNAANEQDAHALMQQDPAMQNKTFTYQLHPMNVFYPGTVNAKKRPAPAQKP
jgi:uncharacterized protein YciI